VHTSAVVGSGSHIDATASVGANCVLGDRVQIGAHTTILPGTIISDDVSMGERVLLYPHITVYANTVIGNDVTVHSGAVLGSDGFGYAKHEGGWQKVPQLGRVCIGDHVHIGANTTIDRGSLGDTVIESHVILDNLIQIAHNVRIGAYTAVAGCVGIAGSVTIGKYCMIGGGTGIAGHLTIADGVVITAKGEVTKSIKQSGVYSSGTCLQANQDWRKSVVHFRQLDKLVRRLKSLEEKVT